MALAVGGAAATGGATGAGGGAGIGGATRGGAALAAGGGAAAGGAGGVTTGFGATTFGAGGAGGAGGLTAGATGLASAGGCATGRTGGLGATAGACCWCSAFSTSPGLEMCDRSILVLISSPSARLGRAGRGAAAGAPARKCARTFSASCSSRELECVFFSVMPTSASTSRIALLLTSSSLARSLIRILVIRPFFSSAAR